MDASFTEADWLPQKILEVASIKLRVWPPKDPSVAQAQWAAVDIWVGMRSETVTADMTQDQKNKARNFIATSVYLLFGHGGQ